jgi:hypothetical protein
MAPRTRTPDGRAASTTKSDAKTQKQQDADALRVFLDAYGRADSAHQKQTSRWRDRHKAYLGILDQAGSSATDKSANHELAPKYAYQTIETLVANLVDQQTRGRVLPLGPDSVAGAKGLEQVMGKYRKLDEEDAKRPRHVRQTAIMGRGPAKVFWTHDIHDRTFRRFTPNADPTQTPTDSRVPGKRVTDRTSFEPLPVYDFRPDPSASRTDQMGYACCDYWVTMDTLKARERRTVDGVEVGAYYNLDLVPESRADTQGDTKSSGRDNRGKILVTEYWTRDRLITVANKAIVIQNDEMPYDHGQLPFIVASTTPDLYSLDGVSIVDVVAPLQGAAWEVYNGLVEAVRLANNLLIKRDVSADHEPRSADGDLERHVPRPQREPGGVRVLDAGRVDPAARPGVPADDPHDDAGDERRERLRLGWRVRHAGGEHRDGVSHRQYGAEAGILVNGMRANIWQEYRRKGLQEIALIQQFMVRGETFREKNGANYDFLTVFPWDIQGECDYDAEDTDADLNENQERQMQLMLLNTLVQAQPVLATTDAQVHFVPMIEKLLEAYGEFDTDTYVTERAPQIAPPAAAPELPPNVTQMLPQSGGAGLGGVA